MENGICSDNFEPDEVATRAFFAGVLGNAVDKSILPEKNIITAGALLAALIGDDAAAPAASGILSAAKKANKKM